ncbi:MAG: (Fe-S)-binding protein [Gemmatimonadetes bacterium]|nr:(Fe-S)-binding protein [Gemmatimonadota bacterium]
MTFAGWEKILLGFLFSVSLALTLKELTPKFRFILAGQSDRTRTNQLARRITRVVKEVFLQWRVIQGRPIVGTLHALVFFGFILFAFETIDHFLEPFQVPFLAFLFGSAEAAVKLFLVAVAVFVIVGITGLFIRRFFMVAISPDPRSWSSGLVAIMIFVLMVTYGYGLTEATGLEKANWWTHAVVILAFPPLITRSKHFHIIMAPINVFFRRDQLGDYLPLNLDLDALAESEDEVTLGLESMDDVPWKMRMDFVTCVECRRCTEQCPAAISGQELNPMEFILAGRGMMGREGELVGNVISVTALGQCTSCGACEDVCPTGIEHLDVLIGAKRAQALVSGRDMVAADFLETIERHGNPFSEPASTRRKLIDELGIPLYRKDETEYLLWMGCTWAYNQDVRSSLTAMVKVLEQARVSYGVLQDESCSGHHSRRQGEELQFQTLAAENIERFRDQAVSRIVAPCPHCLHTFRREYPTVAGGFSIETIHHSELLLELIRDGRITLEPKKLNGRKLTYHDPCYLGRYEDTYDEPRNVIREAGFEITELPRRRERSFCCGGGSAGFAREQDVALRVDQERKREIVDSGAEVLITGCPECKMMLDAAVDETLDLVELVERASPDTP